MMYTFKNIILIISLILFSSSCDMLEQQNDNDVFVLLDGIAKQIPVMQEDIKNIMASPTGELVIPETVKRFINVGLFGASGIAMTYLNMRKNAFKKDHRKLTVGRELFLQENETGNAELQRCEQHAKTILG